MIILSSLHLSCCNGDFEKVKEYLNINNINQINQIFEEKEEDQWTIIQSKELTLIICAIEHYHLLLLQYLHQQGGNIYLLKPLKVACQYKHWSIIDYLLKYLIPKCESFFSKTSSPSSSLSFWYEQSASQWLEALPIENGFLGGMIYEGFLREIIQLNRDTLWAGCPDGDSDAGYFWIFLVNHYRFLLLSIDEN